MLRDRIVCRVLDLRIQRRLLTEPKLTIAKQLNSLSQWNQQKRTPRLSYHREILHKYTLLEPYVIAVEMNIPQILVHSKKNYIAENTQKGTHCQSML